MADRIRPAPSGDSKLPAAGVTHRAVSAAGRVHWVDRAAGRLREVRRAGYAGELRLGRQRRTRPARRGRGRQLPLPQEPALTRALEPTRPRQKSPPRVKRGSKYHKRIPPPLALVASAQPRAGDTASGTHVTHPTERTGEQPNRLVFPHYVLKSRSEVAILQVWRVPFRSVSQAHEDVSPDITELPLAAAPFDRANTTRVPHALLLGLPTSRQPAAPTLTLRATLVRESRWCENPFSHLMSCASVCTQSSCAGCAGKDCCGRG